MVVVASLTLLFLEYLQTLELEVSLVWTSEWSLVKCLYLINRFLPFFVLPFALYYNLTARPSPQVCKVVFAIPCMGIALCIFISEAILYLRVHALSGKGTWILVFILGNGISVFCGSMGLLGYYVALGSWDGSEFAPFVPGCFGKFTENGLLVMIGYLCLLYSGLVTMILCLYFGFKIHWSSRRSPILKVFYRDGTFYFVVLAVMSIANGVAAQFLPARYRFLLAAPQAVMHSTLSTRMILHLRESARAEMGFTTMKNILSAVNEELVVDPDQMHTKVWQLGSPDVEHVSGSSSDSSSASANASTSANLGGSSGNGTCSSGRGVAIV
ncbi:hypothetical protein FA15DRAFT_123053 [Coprinopsis marcescibilis]|uniref:DUF6533 domain-containing protein n=1 Tax=Coprinopsis marcescibilis TaxID=230819 RepID=A0A5C3KJR7_COPMA|nr:hypothetical protein FA15DRAFT_123053 [Coprinopsis marcescibilis]